MPRYISLLRFTEQGAKNMKNSISRAHDFDALAVKAGVRVEGQYWTMGKFDGVLIVSADDQQKVLSMLAALAAQGNVHTETMQAFVDTEFEAIVAK